MIDPNVTANVVNERCSVHEWYSAENETVQPTMDESIGSGVNNHITHYINEDAEDLAKKAVKVALNQDKVEKAMQARDEAKARVDAAKAALENNMGDLSDEEKARIRAAHDYAVEDYAKAKADVSKEKKTREKRVAGALGKAAAAAAKGMKSVHESVTATANVEAAAQKRAAKPTLNAVRKIQRAARGEDMVGQACNSADRQMQCKTVTEGASMPSLVSNGAMLVSAKPKTINDDSYEERIDEAAIKAKYRKALADKSFGVPSKRSYPLTDEKHVRSAISMFKHCPEEDRAELARNIFRAAAKYGMSIEVSPDSTIYNYAPEKYRKAPVNEGVMKEMSDEFKEGYAEGKAAADKVIKKLEDRIAELKGQAKSSEVEDESIGSTLMGGVGSVSGAVAAHSYGKKNRAYREIRSNPYASAAKVAKAKAKAKAETAKYQAKAKKNAVANYHQLRRGFYV